MESTCNEGKSKEFGNHAPDRWIAKISEDNKPNGYVSDNPDLSLESHEAHKTYLLIPCGFRG
jgi:hypothetical protein